MRHILLTNVRAKQTVLQLNEFFYKNNLKQSIFCEPLTFVQKNLNVIKTFNTALNLQSFSGAIISSSNIFSLFDQKQIDLLKSKFLFMVGKDSNDLAKKYGFTKTIYVKNNISDLAQTIINFFYDSSINSPISLIYPAASTISYPQIISILTKKNINTLYYPIYDAHYQNNFSKTLASLIENNLINAAIFLSKNSLNQFLHILKKQFPGLNCLKTIHFIVLSKRIAKILENYTNINISIIPNKTDSVQENLLNFIKTQYF